MKKEAKQKILIVLIVIIVISAISYYYGYYTFLSLPKLEPTPESWETIGGEWHILENSLIGKGAVQLKNKTVKNFIAEYDIKGEDERAFGGLFWRGNFIDVESFNPLSTYFVAVYKQELSNICEVSKKLRDFAQRYASGASLVQKNCDCNLTDWNHVKVIARDSLFNVTICNTNLLVVDSTHETGSIGFMSAFLDGEINHITNVSLTFY